MAVTFTTSGTASAGGVQQSYALVHAALLEGQLSDIRDNTIGTFINETSAVQAFGNVVTYNSGGTVANSAGTISGATNTVLGVNVLTYVDETALDPNSRPGVKTQQVLNVANEGAVAVYVHGAVTPATTVRVIHTATGVQYAGQFRAAALSGKTAVLANARYLSSVTSSGLVVVELNGPSFTLTADTTTG
jgi:hypothetical protein